MDLTFEPISARFLGKPAWPSLPVISIVLTLRHPRPTRQAR